MKTSLLLALALLVSCSSEEQQQTTTEVIASNIIIGQDDRRPVSGSYTSQDRPVGRLVAKISATRESNCTATSLSNDLILTAAHCLYDDQGILRKNMFFIPGVRSENQMPFGRFPVLEAYHPTDFRLPLVNLRAAGNDIAVAKVGANARGKRLSQIVGGLGYWGRSHLPENTTMTTLGYAGDLANGTLYRETNCPVYELGSKTYEVYCDIVGGQSGSPGLFYHAASNAHYIHAVVVGEQTRYNIASVITPERQRIMDQLKEGSFDVNNNSFEERWKKVTMPNDSAVRVLVENRCSQSLYLGTYRHDNNGEANGFYLLAPGETIEAIETQFNRYRLIVLADGGSTYIGGAARDYNHSIRGRTYRLQQFSAQTWGDKIHTLCE